MPLWLRILIALGDTGISTICLVLFVMPLLTISKVAVKYSSNNSGMATNKDEESATGNKSKQSRIRQIALRNSQMAAIAMLSTALFMVAGSWIESGYWIVAGCSDLLLNLIAISFMFPRKLKTEGQSSTSKGENVTPFGSSNMYAILGKSGAGKSTLMSLLCGRTSPSKGEVRVSGMKVGKNELQNYSRFVPTDDTMFTFMTPRELLTYQARLVGSSEEMVEQVLESLKISDCANQNIEKEISSGQRKRVSIALQLLSSPHMLFLDEPTSGLDSETANELVQLMQQFARKNNQLIVMTIHQPSWSTLNIFDGVVLIDSGKIMFSGGDIKGYMNSIDINEPHGENAMDYYITQVKHMPEFVHVRTHANEEVDRIDILKCDVSDVSIVKTLVERYVHNIRKGRIVKDVLFSLLMSSLIALVFYDQMNRSPKTALSCTTMATYVCFLRAQSEMVAYYPTVKKILKYEYENQTFKSGHFIVAQVIAEFNYVLFKSLFYAMPIYVSCGYTSFWGYLSVLMITVILSTVIAISVSITSDTARAATAKVSPLSAPFLIFCGYFIPRNDIPGMMTWIYDISFFRHTNNILVHEEFTGRTFTGDNSTGIDFMYDNGWNEVSSYESYRYLFTYIFVFFMLDIYFLNRMLKN